MRTRIVPLNAHIFVSQILTEFPAAERNKEPDWLDAMLLMFVSPGGHETREPEVSCDWSIVDPLDLIKKTLP